MKANRIRSTVEAGIIPKGQSSKRIIDALFATQGPNVLEMFGILEATHKKHNGQVVELGVVSVQKVTQAFTQYLVDSLQNSTTAPMDAFKYHASGTGSGAEANTETGLVTEVESRVAGTQVEGASTNIFKTVATVAYSATRSIIEHGVFSAAASGTLMDRSVVSAINVENLDEVIWTYQLTCNAET